MKTVNGTRNQTRKGLLGALAASACALLVGASIAPNLLAQAAKPTNPAIIGEFPPVDKVLAAEKASDPDQTAAQQMAAFTQMINMILQEVGPRQFIKDAMTQDELNLRQTYTTALYNIQKTNPKYSNPLAMKGLDFSQTFRNQMIQQLFPPTFQADFTKAVAAAKQQQAQIHNQAVQIGQAQQKAAQPAEQAALQQLQQQVQQQQQENNMDPQTREMRRCVSSGRVMATCTGNALMGSLMPNVNGILSSVAPGMVGKEVTGPQMAGVFAGAAGWRLEFSEASVALSCQDMIPDSHAYTISFANNRATLDIAAMPKDVVLSLDGSTLSGSAAIPVQGRISLGVHQGLDYQTGKQADIYQYQVVTRNCAKPVLNASNSPGVVGAEKNLLTGLFNDGDSGPPTPTGLRMNGSYANASTGFSVEFFPESVILGCGPDVARAYPYTVVADGKQAVIKVAAPTPVTLQIKSGNALDPGSGSYQVQGRKITGQDSNGDYTFTPLNANCNLASLTPGPIPSSIPGQPGQPGVSPIVAALAGGGAPPASAPGARPAAPAAPAPAPADPFGSFAGVAIPTTASGPAVLTVSSAPSGSAPSPLAGRRYVLLRDDVNNIISKSGAAMNPGISPIMAMSYDCARNNADCQKINNALKAASVSAVVADKTGKGVLPGVAPGTYYLMTSAANGSQMIHWSVRVALNAGQNQLTLSPQNGSLN